MWPVGGLEAEEFLYFHSNAPEDGKNNCPKHVELIRIINKQLLLHLVGCLIIYINDARLNKYQMVIPVSLI
jgi:hypothetical protein